MTTPVTGQAGHDQATVDAILDAALDELDDDSDDDDDYDDDETADNEANNNQSNDNVGNSSIPKYQDYSSVATTAQSSVNKVVFGPEKPPPSPPEVKQKWQQDDVNPTDKMIHQMMDQLMKDPNGFESAMEQNNPFENDEMLEKMMYDMQLQLQTELSGGAVWGSNNNNNNKSEPTTRQQQTTSTKKKVSKSNNKEKQVVVSEAIANIVDEMSQPTTSTSADETTMFESQSSDNMDFGSEMNMFNGILKDMQEEMQDGKFNDSSVLDGMMEQLLSKDLMYEPIKQVAIKFPNWLEQHKTILSPKEYSERSKQSEMFQKLVKLYETDPTNTPKLMECMQEIQEFGQPPVEIIKDIAPGIDLDEDGMPIFDSKSGLPPFFTQVGKDEECNIM